MAMELTYSMNDLVQLTGLDARTIRYYITQGLLPRPLKRGRGADYSQSHLDRLKLIVVLKGTLKLDEIQARLNSVSPDEIRQLLDKWVEPPSKSSAISYLKSVEEDFQQVTTKPVNLDTPTFIRRKLGKPDTQSSKRKLESLKENPFQSSKFDSSTSQSSYFAEEFFPERSGGKSSKPINRLIEKLDPIDPPNFESSYRRARTWKVIQITPGIELHLKDPDDLTLTRMERAGELIRNILTGVDDD
jgi:DNA-binding transcriptional MerR regulator